MTNKEWQKLFEILDNIHSDFLMHYPYYKNGRNQKIRDDGLRKAENAIQQADFHILENWESYILLTGGEENTDYGRTIIYDEFKQPRYFGNDMANFLTKIKEKLKNLSD